MLARLRDRLVSSAASFGAFVLEAAGAIVEDDREADMSATDDAERRGVIRYGTAMTDSLMRLRCGHGFDEAARLAVEAGAERITGYLTLSGRDPPP